MKEASVINARKIAPSVSMIIPTDKSYPQYRVDEGKLKSLLKKLEDDLLAEFPENETRVIVNKFKKLIASIEHEHLSNAIAMFVSPETEKLFYLPFPVQEKLIIDSSFEIRDLIYSTKNHIDYLLLVITNHQPKVYHGYNNSLVEIKLKDMPLNIETVKRDYPTKVTNFSDEHTIEEINLERYLKQIDDSLSEILKQIDSTVIISGVKKTIGYFKRLTRNSKKIAAYVEGSYGNSSKEEIAKAIEPSIIKLRETAQQKTMDKLEEALNTKEYASGIKDVWRAAKEKKGRLLIVEKDFSCAAKMGKDDYTLITDGFDKKDPDVIADIVDDVIEIVLKNNGDIVFVDNGKLTDHKGITLITRY